MSPTRSSWTLTWDAKLTSNMAQKSKKWAAEGRPEPHSNITPKTYAKWHEKACPWIPQNIFWVYKSYNFQGLRLFQDKAPMEGNLGANLRPFWHPEKIKTLIFLAPDAFLASLYFWCFFSCCKMCFERQLGGQKVPQQPQEAARRLSGDGAGMAPKSTQERKPAQDAPDAPKRCSQTPFGDQFWSDFSNQFGIFCALPQAFLWSHVASLKAREYDIL